MPSISTWKQINAASGLYFGVFLVMHMISHYATAIGGVENGNSMLLKFRVIYQNPIFEILLFVSLFAHMASNTVIYMHRSKIEKSASEKGKKELPKISAELSGHRIAGYILVFSIFGHVFATRVMPLIYLDDSSDYDYSFASAAHIDIPYYIFAVYLTMLGCAGGWHLIYGTRAAIATLQGSSVTGKEFPFILKPIAMASHILILLTVLATMGITHPVDLESKAEYHDKFAEILLKK